MLDKSMLIKRLGYLEKIDLLVEKYERKLNREIPNVSGWQISETYKEKMLTTFNYELYGDFNPIDYVYSYNLVEKYRQKILSKLGACDDNCLLLVSNNTIALVNAVNFIANIRPNKVGLLLPCYFTIPNLLRDRNLPYFLLPMKRENGEYHLPQKGIIKNNCNVLILTNPVFSTGKYLGDADINFLRQYLSGGNYVVADESLAVPGFELIRSLGHYKNFISIYSPHKFIHFNAFKFSCMVYNKIYEDFFDQWNDVYSGGLNITNLRAINHFLSPDYDNILNLFLNYTAERSKEVSQLASAFPQFEIDSGTIGDYMCLYNNTLPYKLGNQISFVKDVITQTQSVFYPGCLHGFQQNHGFVFRINLVSYNHTSSNALVKILDFLTQYK